MTYREYLVTINGNNIISTSWLRGPLNIIAQARLLYNPYEIYYQYYIKVVL